MLSKLTQIENIARKEPGIALSVLAKRVDLPIMATRWRVYELVEQRKLRLVREPRRMYIYPVDEHIGKAAIADSSVASN